MVTSEGFMCAVEVYGFMCAVEVYGFMCAVEVGWGVCGGYALQPAMHGGSRSGSSSTHCPDDGGLHGSTGKQLLLQPLLQPLLKPTLTG